MESEFLNKGQMLVEENGKIYVFKYEPNQFKLMRYKESFLNESSLPNYGVGRLTTNNFETLTKFREQRRIKISNINYKNQNGLYSYFDVIYKFPHMFGKREMETLNNYIFENRPSIIPSMIHDNYSKTNTCDFPIYYYIRPRGYMRIDSTYPEYYKTQKFLLIPRKLYLLGMLEHGIVNEASKGDISVQARCFDYNKLEEFDLEFYKQMADYGVIEYFSDEQIHNQARMGTRILQKGGILK